MAAEHTIQQATDILWMLLSVRNWEQLTLDCGWSRDKYLETTKLLARRIFVADKIAD